MSWSVHSRSPVPPAPGLHAAGPGLRDKILRHSRGLPNDGELASILSSWVKGHGCLPAFLGLPRSDYREMLEWHFPDLMLNPPCPEAMPMQALDERQEIRRLLLAHRALRDPSEFWVAGIIAVACMGRDHLWHDLGLDHRRQLNELMQRNFPELARRNVKDMKWKKFLYRELCLADGSYVCRAPSCEACADHALCFGPED